MQRLPPLLNACKDTRAMPEVSHLFLRLEHVIRLYFLPALLRRQVNDIEREVLSLPARLGGLGISKPHCNSVDAHENSKKLSEPLVKLILRQEFELDPSEIADEVKHLRLQIDDESQKVQALKLEFLLKQVSEEMKFAMKNTVERSLELGDSHTTIRPWNGATQG